MNIYDLTYEEAAQRHPKEVASIIAKLRKGKSKSKNVSETELKWNYECSTIVPQNYDINKIAALSIDEQVAEQVSRTATALKASHGRWWSDELLCPYGGTTSPQELANCIRRGFEERAKEKAEMDALTDEERDAKVHELLSQLVGTKGFFAIG